MPYVNSFLAVLTLALLHILCGRLPLIHSVRHSNWLSFSGGVTVAYVFESLLPLWILGFCSLTFLFSGGRSRSHAPDVMRRAQRWNSTLESRNSTFEFVAGR